MRPSGPTFWRIGGRNGWTARTAQSDLAVSDADGLRLAADPAGPLSLASRDGSAGGLALPRSMAFDADNTLYLLAGDHVRRFDPEIQALAVLPEVGGRGAEPRRFSGPASIAIAANRLHVADTGNRRIQVFDLASFALVDLIDAAGCRAGWIPADVAARDGGVYILDSAHARVYRRGRTGHLRLEFENAAKPGQWSRILIDKTGELYLLNLSRPGSPVLDRPDPKAAPITDAGAVRDLFDPPVIRLDEQDRFCLPEPLTRVCGRTLPAAPPVELALALCPPFDRPGCSCGNAAPATRTASTAQGAWLLYVVERKRRCVDAYTDARRLRHSWPSGLGGGDWQPCDVAARGQFAFILDEMNQVVYRHHAGYDALRPIVTGDPTKTYWSRIAADESGVVYLWAPGQPDVQAFDCLGAPQCSRPYGEVACYFEARCTFPPPACGTGLCFDKTGAPVGAIDASAPIATAFYRTAGAWQSTPLDSLQYRCQWHRIEMVLSSFPPSSRIDVLTFAHDNAADVLTAPDEAWQQAATVIAPTQTSPSGSVPEPLDCLVQSGAGQFLSIRIKVRSDGFHTPAVHVMKVHYPRDSYLQYLPATYSEDDESRVFLEHFLAIVQTEWDGLDQVVATVQRYFDPDAVPAGPFLDYLAEQWLGLTLEQTWTADQKRRYLAAAPTILPQRGKVGGLRNLIAVYLANFTDRQTADILATGFPFITEGFRERRHMFIDQGAPSRLGDGAPLWSDAIVRRLQLGRYSQVGEAALVSTGDPAHDLFDKTAHRFRVSFPASWLRSADNEIMLRRAIDSEKPAHTAYDLNLVEPRFRVGAQSTIGIDTIIGELPSARLGVDTAFSRLGYGTVLNGPCAVEMRLGRDILLGARSILS
jgi:phage tail-like protein